MDWKGHGAKTGLLRNGWVSAGAIVGLASLVAGLIFGGQVLTAHAATPAGTPLRYNAKHSAPVPAGAHTLGRHNANGRLQVELVLNPRNESGLNTLIQQINTPGSSVYHHWLTPAQFNADFAPATFDTSWLTNAGLRQVAGPSPLVLAFTGTASQMDAAFHTTINDYRTTDGRTVYANATAPQVPASVAANIAGVVGLDNVQSNAEKPEIAKPMKKVGKLDGGKYGAGPGGNGLTPSQIQGIYNANSTYRYSTGRGVTGAVFELSGYTQSDIRAYETQFGLPKTKLQDINIDGGPCPAAASYGLPCDYGAIEDELDIQFMQAIAPGISKIQVYLGPNTDQGVLDTYFAIANQNTASVVSTSWGECEPGLSAGVAQGEFYSFAQMALQGQSISSAAGDNGSYDCLGTFGQPYPSVSLTNQTDDPTTDPLMTSVGGTSFFGTFDPGSNLHPTYPTGAEYVWNTLNNCSNSDFIAEGVDLSAAFGGVLCPFGAGGGGNSTIWARAPWQRGAGVTSSASTFGASCGQKSGVQCREVPDVSLLADPNSGYVTYCTDTGGGCDPNNPWLQIGGTSCSSPIWAGIVGLAVSAGHHRVGLTTPLLYALNSNYGHKTALHDMVGGATFTFDWSGFFGTPLPPVTVTTNSNGVGSPAGFSETPNYDMATGVGTPNVAGMVRALAFDF